MNQYTNSVYEKTFNFTTPGTYGYKVAMNGSYDESYGKDGGNIPLVVTQAGNVTFKFNYKTKEVFDSINNPEAFKTSATVVGSLPDVTWDPANTTYDMNYMGDNFYKNNFTFAPASYEYKVAYNHGWDNGEIGSNVSLNLSSVTEDTDVTFISNPDLGICTDSVNTPEILNSLSLIGTIRGDESTNWDVNNTDFDFSYLNNNGVLIYDGLFQTGDYQYKAVENYSWTTSYPSGDNKTISIPKDNQYVIFVADPANGTVIDSINNPAEVDAALGFKPVSNKSVTVEENGSVTFKYTNADASKVYVAGSFTEWGNFKQPMSKVEGSNDLWEVNLRMPSDSATTYEYKFIVDDNWITDPENPPADGESNSKFDIPEYTGRTVVLVGTIQSAAGEDTWNPASDVTKMDYIGCGQYSITLKDVPAAAYEYKVAMGSWDENYGANGISGGDNIALTVSKTQDVTFYYSDDSNQTVNSIEYKFLDISLTGTSVPADTKLTDPYYKSSYCATVFLNAGTFTDFMVHVGGKDIPVGTITVAENTAVNISYDPVCGIVYNDSSDVKLVDDVCYDSQDLNYKSPYGAVKAGEEITFNLNAGSNDLTVAKLKVVTPTGVELIDMAKNGTFDDGKDKWTAKYSSNNIGLYKYAFIISNGSDAKAYADSDGYWGKGGLNNIGADIDFGFNIYQSDFKTPDWMKNAVVYQIFPDRFFNGDTSNDYAELNARGETKYEFYKDWYSLTEIPTYMNDDGYTGPKGDGVWCNEIYGGDINGIEQKLDYLQSLGVNVLYMNPVSQSISNHRYDATDYTKLDSILGSMEDFEELASSATQRGMHIILDGVFNHVSDDSVYFDRYNHFVEEGKPLGAYQYWSSVYDKMTKDTSLTQDAAKQIVENEYKAKGITDFHYADWFKIDNKIVTDTVTGVQRYDYEGWWGYDSMPVIKALNGSEYNVTTWADEIIDGEDANSRLWLKEGSSGWRLDVANEVSDETWEHFRNAVKEEGDNVIIGEIWTDASKYLLGNMYDSVMNYRFRGSVIDFINGNKSSAEITKNLELIREQYPKEAFDAMLNLVDSHDTERILFDINGDNANSDSPDYDYRANPVSNEAKAKMRLVPLMQMTYPGAPCIYYGDEAGMTGGKDPDCRLGMVWGKGDKDLVEWYAKLANIRNDYEVLRTGNIIPKASSSDDIFVFERTNDDDYALVVINRGNAVSENVKVLADNGTALTNVLDPSQTYTVTNGNITVNVPAIGGVILVKNYKETNVNYKNLECVYNEDYIVKDKISVTSIEISKTEASLKGDETLTLEVTVSPENATCKNVYWKSSNESVATVLNGTVTGIGKGTAIISAISYDGSFEKTCTVTVTSDGTTTPTQPAITPAQPRDPHDKETTTKNIGDVVSTLKDGDNLLIKVANDNKSISGDVLSKIKGKDIDVTIDLGNGIEWTFNGKDIPETWEAKDINFNVNTEKSGIFADILKAVFAGENSMTLSLDFDGEFGFAMTLSVHIGYLKDGQYANIYYYNPETKALEFKQSSKINSAGNAKFDFEHASDYVILIGNNAASASDTTDTTKKTDDDADSNPVTGNRMPIVPVCLVAILSVTTLKVVRKKSNSK